MTVLRPRPGVIALVAAAAALMGFVLVAAVRADASEAGPRAVVALSALMLALMLWALWLLPRMSYVLTDHDVAVLSGRRERGRIRFEDLSVVRPARSGSHWTRGWDHALYLTGTSAAGREVTLRMGGNLVPSLRPVLVALEPVVTARPELLPEGRRLFDELLVEAP